MFATGYSEALWKKNSTQKRVNAKICVGGNHTDGPVLHSYRNFTQHRTLQLDGFYLSANENNNCVQIGSHFGLIRNILKDPQDSASSGMLVMFQRFMVVTDFFQSPLKSSSIGIIKVSRLSDTIKAQNVSDIVCKFYRIPYKETFFVLVPLTHCFCWLEEAKSWRQKSCLYTFTVFTIDLARRIWSIAVFTLDPDPALISHWAAETLSKGYQHIYGVI